MASYMTYEEENEYKLRQNGSHPDYPNVKTRNKYTRTIKGVEVDVYDILHAYQTGNSALDHLIKKALCAGSRGHKDRLTDLDDIVASAKRAKELELY